MSLTISVKVPQLIVGRKYGSADSIMLPPLLDLSKKAPTDSQKQSTDIDYCDI